MQDLCREEYGKLVPLVSKDHNSALMHSSLDGWQDAIEFVYHKEVYTSARQVVAGKWKKDMDACDGAMDWFE